MSVAESIVIFPPMSQVGCASASSRVTESRSVRPRNGPPLAVRTSRSIGARPLARDQLEERGMLGVHGQQLRPRGLCESGHQLAADDEALLVRQCEVDALPERRHRGAQAGRADQRVEDEVAVRVRDQLDEALGAGQHLDLRALARPRGRVRLGEGDPLDPVRGGLLEQQLPARGGRQANDLQLGVALDDVQGLGAY